jgi:hypothetical protein
MDRASVSGNPIVKEHSCREDSLEDRKMVLQLHNEFSPYGVATECRSAQLLRFSSQAHFRMFLAQRPEEKEHCAVRTEWVVRGCCSEAFLARGLRIG